MFFGEEILFKFIIIFEIKYTDEISFGEITHLQLSLNYDFIHKNKNLLK